MAKSTKRKKSPAKGKSSKRSSRAKKSLTWDEIHPGDKGAAISTQTAKHLDEWCRKNKPKRVLDLGTGQCYSLGIMVNACPKNSEFYTVDQNGEYSNDALFKLMAWGIPTDRVSVIHAGFTTYKWRSHTQNWYNVNTLKQIPGKLDLIYVDGPQGGHGRMPALMNFLTRMSKRSTIMLDDARRPGEQSWWKTWQQLLTRVGIKHTAEMIDTDRGLAIINLEKK